jgi:hypothetical protein
MPRIEFAKRKNAIELSETVGIGLPWSLVDGRFWLHSTQNSSAAYATPRR